MDSLPKLPETASGCKHCLLLIDIFSKWVELVPMKMKSSEEVAEAIFPHILARFGIPKETRDCGRESFV